MARTMHGELTDEKSFCGAELNHAMTCGGIPPSILPEHLPQSTRHADLVSLPTSPVGYLGIQD